MDKPLASTTLKQRRLFGMTYPKYDSAYRNILATKGFRLLLAPFILYFYFRKHATERRPKT